MDIARFIELLDCDFYTGVPDSQLKPLCDYLQTRFGDDSRHHIIGANEGNCVALAAGYHLATGKVPVVYLQNSGEGNIVNPVASLLNEEVYGIPVLFVIGWRGEPGVYDEPQHIFQGKITLNILEDLNIPGYVVRKDTAEREVAAQMEAFRSVLAAGRQAAFVIAKDSLRYAGQVQYQNENTLVREEVIRRIAAYAGDDLIVSTTGKASRELFEIRELGQQSHQMDLLTLGSMGHSSSIALGIALHRPEKRVWCIDGDGAALMHMGAMAVIGASKPKNLVHIVINNSAHESVGGMPTAAGKIDLTGIARACGYPQSVSVSTMEELDSALQKISSAGKLTLLEAKCAIGARKNLGRPTIPAKQQKEQFMKFVSEECAHGTSSDSGKVD